MKKFALFAFLILILILASCTGSDVGEPTKEKKETKDESAPALPTLDTSLVSPGYPEPIIPEATPVPQIPEGYPALPVFTPTPYIYPEDMVFWMLHPAGFQCESPLYETLDQAVSALNADGVTVDSSEVINLMVCQACGCPTSEHYRVSIQAGDYEAAVALGWVRE